MKRQTLFFIALFIATLAFSEDYIAFSGIIRDSQTGKIIEGADVFIKDIETGTITNETGEFYMFIIPGKHDVIISIKGYNSENLSVNFDADIFYEIILAPKLNGYEPAKWIPRNLETNKNNLQINPAQKNPV